VVIGLLGNKSFHSNRFTLVLPKSENDVRLRATLGSENPTGLPVGVVSMEIEKEIQVAIDIVKAYEVTRKKGILAIKDYSFDCDEFKFMTDIYFECFQNALNNNQIYDILNNYGESFENKKIHKLIINGLMCIISGEKIEYLELLLVSILGRDERAEFKKEVEKVIGLERKIDTIRKKYEENKAFSSNTNLLEGILIDTEKIKIALSEMNNTEVKYILLGISGDSAKKIISVIGMDMLKIIDEELIENIEEKDIIDAEKKFLSIINEA